MFRKTILVLAGLLALASPAAAQLTLTGAGGGGSAAVYSPGATYLQGETASYQPWYKRASALSGVSNGGKGIVSFWANCNGSANAAPTGNERPRCVLGDVMMNNSMLQGGGLFSEGVDGLNVIFDTAAPTTAGCGTLRLNTNNTAWLYASAPEFGLQAHDAYCTSDFGKWAHYLIVWDHSTNTFCGAVYKNGVLFTSSHNGGTGFTANYSNSTGFVYGTNGYDGQGDSYNGALAEIYVNFAPASTPCVSDAIANYSVSSFYSAGNPVDLGTNCATPTGVQPAVCARWNTDGSPKNVNYNEGSGGAFTAAFAQGIAAAPFGPGATPTTAPYLKYVTGVPGGIPGTSLPFTPSFNNYVPVAGDLIIVWAGTTWSSPGASTITLSTANGFSSLAAGSTAGGGAPNYEVFGMFYKIATGGDSLPSITTSRALARVATYVVTVYGNAHQTTPIGVTGTWSSNDVSGSPTSLPCVGFSPGQSGSLIASVGFVWNNNYTSETMTGNNSQMRYLSYAVAHSGGVPGVFWNDYVNSGTTVVGATTTTTSSGDVMGCYQFEIKHP